mmetsp:Transcript_16118/g.49972  ORF Transcript_16118/g.49972 Transcript_16118/m.49972 type:complete len:300 (-) Transcript_16118:373-1272(-)
MRSLGRACEGHCKKEGCGRRGVASNVVGSGWCRSSKSDAGGKRGKQARLPDPSAVVFSRGCVSCVVSLTVTWIVRLPTGRLQRGARGQGRERRRAAARRRAVVIGRGGRRRAAERVPLGLDRVRVVAADRRALRHRRRELRRRRHRADRARVTAARRRRDGLGVLGERAGLGLFVVVALERADRVLAEEPVRHVLLRRAQLRLAVREHAAVHVRARATLQEVAAHLGAEALGEDGAVDGEARRGVVARGGSPRRDGGHLGAGGGVVGGEHGGVVVDGVRRRRERRQRCCGVEPVCADLD